MSIVNVRIVGFEKTGSKTRAITSRRSFIFHSFDRIDFDQKPLLADVCKKMPNVIG